MAGTQYVDAKAAAQGVIAEFGAERVAWVLAGNVNYYDWDGRLSNSNKEWAKGFDTSATDVNYLKSHLTIVDSFVSRFRELERETPAPALTSALENAGQEVTPDTTPHYAVGDTVYLENDATFIIDGINDREITLRDPDSNPFMPFVRVTPVERFELEYSNNPQNADSRAEPTTDIKAADSVQMDLFDLEQSTPEALSQPFPKLGKG
jgi:hypothetical protein